MRPVGTKSYGDEPSTQASTLIPNPSSGVTSRSTTGNTNRISPTAGTTSAENRSYVSNRNPVKYANCSPGPSTNPANPRREHNSCARRNLPEYVDTETESLMALS